MNIRNYYQLLGYARQQKWLLIAVVPLTLLGAVATACQPWPIKFFADHVVGATPVPASVRVALHSFFLEPTPSILLTVVILGTIVVFILNNAVSAVLSWLQAKAGNRVIFNLAEEVFARLQRYLLSDFRHMKIGDLMTRVFNDTRCVYQLLNDVLCALLQAFLTMAIMLILMAYLNLSLTFIALAGVVGTLIVSLLFRKRFQIVSNTKRQIEGQASSYVQQALTGIPLIQSFGQEETEKIRFRKIANAHIKSQQLLIWVTNSNRFISNLVTTLAASVVLWLLAHEVLNGALSLGGAIVFAAYFRNLQRQSTVLVGVISTFQILKANMERVIEILDYIADSTKKTKTADVWKVCGHVKFENVTAGYSCGKAVLKNVTLEAAPGQMIGIVGRSGVGKTSLLNLISRFDNPWEGRILIDGHDIRGIPLPVLRANIATVFQESFLFPVSIAENIAIGRPDASFQEIEAAARSADAHNFIISLPAGYKTLIGERGLKLSGGMRQRLAIARALLKNSPILILDEITSALDSETERRIVETLCHQAKQRTIFIIAHRLSTVRHADLIVVIHNGRIVETGGHEQLLNAKGYYAKFYRAQVGPQELIQAL